MPCFYPLAAWRSSKLNESGKRGITFSRSEGFDDMSLDLPCGKCDGCRADKSRYWAVRMYHESQLHDRNSFVTLTYADPCPEKLDKSHLQDFFKRARHEFKFRYFACGEYGEQTRRPHYHVCFFGEDFLAGSDQVSDSLYSNPILSDAWGHGHVACAEFNMSTACYVAGYVYKKVGDTDTFTLMSRRPGIGHDWLSRYQDDLRRTGSVVVEGKELPIPPRYFDWEPEALEEVKLSRRALVVPKDLNALRNKEKNKKSQLSLRSHKI